MLADIREARAAAFRVLAPPPHLKLSGWLEKELRLPATSAQPGPIRLWPFQRAIADAIGDPAIERVTVVKPTRIGYTSLLVGAIASYVANEPTTILALLPTEGDARDFTVSDLEPLFQATPAVAAALSANEHDRSTLLSRQFGGGSLKIVAARAPRNLRRHSVRVLLADEVDAMEVGAEGDPIKLAERRTLSFANRKLVCGSTPIFSDTSAILRLYAESDGRVFEIPCPECGGFTEILWQHIEWPEGDPSSAKFCCPHCKAPIEERHKQRMVAAGQWRVTRPEVRDHAGFRLNALVSPLANASWGKLANEFLNARESPEELQVFANTILGEGWHEGGEEVDETALISRAEAFTLDAIPKEVLLITCGCDLQDDRVEVSVVGWTRKGEALVLAHVVVWGTPDDDVTWRELDELLRSRWQHPFGGSMGVDATAIDSGDGEWTDRVYKFCFPRASRRIMAIKGMYGTRPDIQASKGKMKGGGRLWIAGVDGIKTTIFSRLQRGQMIRFSHNLEPAYFEQLASERRVVRYKRGQPVRRFERISGRARAEALDCLVYAFSARAAVTNVNFDAREDRLKNPTTQRASIAALIASQIAQ
jgi:phage terminase large subunit GpA-like protein